MKKLLEVKERLKRRRPTFKRQESYLGRVDSGWKKPKGLQSKLRLSHKGNRKPLRSGYQTPKAVRGLTRDGLLPVTVVRVEELAELSPEKHTVVVGKVGGKNKISIIEAAVTAKFVLHNATVQKAEDLKRQFADRSKAKQTAKKKKEVRDKKLEEKLEKKEKRAEEKAKKDLEKAVAVKKTPEVKVDKTQEKVPEVAKGTGIVEKKTSVPVEKKEKEVINTPVETEKKAPDVKKALEVKKSSEIVKKKETPVKISEEKPVEKEVTGTPVKKTPEKKDE